MTRGRFAGIVTAALFSALPATINAAEVSGGVTVGVSRTDNVTLAPSPNEVSDTVYRVIPFLNVNHVSPNLDANLRYRLDYLKYSDLDSTSTFHMGEARLIGKAFAESLAVELGARRRQVLNDADAVIPSGRLPLTRSFTDRDEIWLNPRYRHTFGSKVTLDMSYRMTEGRYDDQVFQNDNSQNGIFRLENYSAGQGLTWALRYNWRRTEYDVSPPWEYQLAAAEVGYWVSSKTRVFASGGKESAWDRPLDPSMEDSLWEFGIAYASGANLTAEIAAGERSFGSSWRGLVDYQFRSGNMTIRYDEAPTTSGFDRAGRQAPILNPDGIDDLLIQPGRAESYLLKRLSWNLQFNRRRTGFGLGLFAEDRSGRIQADGTSLPDQDQVGITAQFSWQVGARTEFVATGRLFERQTNVNNESELLNARLDINYRIGSRSTLTLSYDYSDQQPRGAALSNRDYVANVVSLSFTIAAL